MHPRPTHHQFSSPQLSQPKEIRVSRHGWPAWLTPCDGIFTPRPGKRGAGVAALLLAALAAGLAVTSCSSSGPPPVEKAAAAAIAVTVEPQGAAVLKTASAEFDVLANGYIQAFMIKDGKKLTLDEPVAGPAGSGEYCVVAGKPLPSERYDFEHAKISEVSGDIGKRGKRLVITGRVQTPDGTAIDKTLSVEVYEEFPGVALATLTYRNAGTSDVVIDRVVAQRHRLNASLADERAAPYQLWSFQGSSYAWGKDDVLPISQKFSQPNLMGGPTPKGLGGGVPVIDFWTAGVGMAIGHVETSPRVVSLPVQVEKDGRIDCSLVLEPHVTLKPGEAYSTPRSFVAVHSGDFYEALRLWSRVLQEQGWTLPQPTNSDYSVNWCGWGYESDFTPAEMLGTIPKLKDLKITWATLDYRWFNNYGDWEPRADTFPADAIRKVVDEYHKNGILIQLWWQPIAVEDGQGRHSLPKPMATSRLSKEHEDWLILDKDGRHARMGSPVSAVAAMCPALPEVREYHRQLVEKFIREWDFDGSKLDSIFTVPPCFNPKHKHQSPNDSIRAMADVYKVILDTTRALKPGSVTQICPCGTTPNYAWLPFMDQAVTADPVGSVQVRRRVKMYKALLGPESAVYGDHVELSGMVRMGDDYIESGEDFASTVGTGGVVGTKFTWPGDAPNPKTRKVRLTAEKEAHWKKWIDIYNSKMLSRGTFLNLYTLGYDVPEGYAIRKGGKMYYAFFAPQNSPVWKGEVELRGLSGGKYRVLDYANSKDLGVVDAASPKLVVGFRDRLLIELTRL